MGYVDETTMAGSVPVPLGSVDTPGQSAGTKMFNDGENIHALVLNRPVRQLAENCDIIKASGDRPLAQPEVIVVAGADSATVTFTVGGGAGNPSAGVYVGDSLYSAPDSCRLIVSVLDEDYNEVQDPSGDEIVCIAMQRADTHVDLVGQGTDFWDSTDIELIFSSPLVSGADYRITLGVESTWFAARADVLLHSKVRANQEVDADTQKQMDQNASDIGTNASDIGTNVTSIGTNATNISKRVGFVTCAESGVADYVGASAITDALAALGDDTCLFVRSGAYTLGNTAVNDVTIEGESADAVIITGNPAFSGNRVTVKNLTFTYATQHYLTFSGDRALVENLVLNKLALALSGDHSIARGIYYNTMVYSAGIPHLYLQGLSHNVSQLSSSGAFDVAGLIIYGSNHSIENVVLGTLTRSGVTFQTNCRDARLSNVEISNDSDSTPTVTCQNSSTAVLYNCSFENADDGGVLLGSGTCKPVFHDCYFESTPTTALNTKMIEIVGEGYAFYDCTFKSYSPGNGSVTGIISMEGSSHLENCVIEYSHTGDPGGRFLYMTGASTLINCKVESKSTTGAANGFVYIQGATNKCATIIGCEFINHVDTGAAGSIRVIEFDRVSGKGITLDRSSLSASVRDYGWLKINDSDINGIRVISPTSAITYTSVAASGSVIGFIVSITGSIVRNFKMSLAPYSGSGDTTKGPPVISAYESTIEEMTFTGTYYSGGFDSISIYPVLLLSDSTKVTNLHVDGIRFVEGDGSRSLVKLGGYGHLIDTYISLDGACALQAVVGTDSFAGSIRGGYINVPASSVAAVKHCLYLANVTCVVSDCELVWSGSVGDDILVGGTYGMPVLVYGNVSRDSEMVHLHHNVVKVADIANVSGAAGYPIVINVADISGVTNGGSGGCLCSDNTIYALANSNSKIISINYPEGIPNANANNTNHLMYAT